MACSRVNFTFFFFNGSTAPWGPRPPHFSRLHDHTQLDTPHSVDSSGRGTSSLQRPLPDNTQHSQETDIHALGEIRTHNPSKRAAVDPHLRLRGHWDWLTFTYILVDFCPCFGWICCLYVHLFMCHEDRKRRFLRNFVIIYYTTLRRILENSNET
jgi:hypothetical protein